jgi:hypothetical protein
MLPRGVLGTVAFIVLFFIDVTEGITVATNSIQIKIPIIFVFIIFIPPLLKQVIVAIQWIYLNVWKR